MPDEETELRKTETPCTFKKGKEGNKAQERQQMETEYERQGGSGVVMIPALRDLAHPLAYWLTWSAACKVADV